MLSTTQIEQYRCDGAVLVPGLLTAEKAKQLRTEAHGVIDRLSQHHEVEATWESASRATGISETALSHCHDVQYHSAAFTRLLTDPRLIAAADLVGTPNIQMHHNKLFVKPPTNGSAFPLHQDWPFFPHAGNTTMAMIVHLDDATEEKGCLRVVLGSHLDGRKEHVGASSFHLDPNEFPLDLATPIPAKAGDVLFFSCLTIHGSGVNLSDDARTTWLLQVRDASDVPTVDRHRSPGQGMMLGGVNSGVLLPPSAL